MKNVIIKNVDNFKVIDNELVYNSLNSIFNSSHIIFQSKSKLWGQIISKNLFFIKNDEVRGILNLNQGFNVIDFPENLNIINGTYDSISNTIVGGKILHDMFLSYSKINLRTFNEDSLKFQFDYSFPIIANELYFFQKNDNVVCFKEYTETTLWQYSVADLGAEKMSKILGVFGETLVVVCEMPHPTIKGILIELYLGIDIQSGQLVWQTQEIILPNGETDYMGANQNRWQWLESATTLYALAGRNYFEFDTQTGQINIPTDIYQQLLGRHLDSIQSNSMEGDFLYFRAVVNTLGGFHSAIGAFNIIEKQITWHHTPKDMFESGGFIKNDQPKVSGNKIYVLDSQNTLHIFEREDETPDLNQ